MKIFKLINVVVLLSIFILIGCKTQKQNIQDENEIPDVEVVELPCQKFALDDEEYYREFASSSPLYSIGLARKNAVDNACHLLKQRLFGGDGDSFYLSYEIECQNVSYEPDGMCVAYVVIKSKKTNN